jgi:hypothetical protein
VDAMVPVPDRWAWWAPPSNPAAVNAAKPNLTQGVYFESTFTLYPSCFT